MLDSYIGEVRMFAGKHPPQGWLLCNGQDLKISDYELLFGAIGTKWGGDGKDNFRLPDLRLRICIGSGQGKELTGRQIGETGGSWRVRLALENLPSHSHDFAVSAAVANSAAPVGFLARAAETVRNFIEHAKVNVAQEKTLGPLSVLKVGGNPDDNSSYPLRNMMATTFVNFMLCAVPNLAVDLDDEYVGVIRAFAFQEVPAGWAACDGRPLAIRDHPDLYAVIGNAFAGPMQANDRNLFFLPDFRGQAVGHVTDDDFTATGGQLAVGSTKGSNQATITPANMPPHNHELKIPLMIGTNAYQNLADAPTRTAFISRPLDDSSHIINVFSSKLENSTTLDGETVGSVRKGQTSEPHENRQPYLALNYCICTDGVFPVASEPKF